MGAAIGGSRGGRAPIVAINITPMVDVVLVLLVIMMVSATYIVTKSILVDLPKAAQGDSSDASLAIVTIEKDGTTRWNDEVVSEPELIAHFQGAVAENPGVNLVVNADQAVPHGNVVRVLDLARVESITHFAISVEHSE